MERYSHLQAIPNSPLTPLTPLSENTKFEFNFGGDGSLDMYINSVRKEHHIEQQRKKLLQRAKRNSCKKSYAKQPKRYSEEFLKIRDVFETHDQPKVHDQRKEQNCSCNCYQNKQQHTDPVTTTPKASIVKIKYTENTPTGTRSNTALSSNSSTIKVKNLNIPQKFNSKRFCAQGQLKLEQKKIMQEQHHLKINQNLVRQATPVAVKPLCPQVARILEQSGLRMYCELFQKEEIDFLTLHLLNIQDLHTIGIKNRKHCAILLENFYSAGHHL